jgi:hypothetical protein
VLVHGGHDWACKCWSTRGMSGHKITGHLKGMLYSSSAGTLTSVKMIEMIVESVLPPYMNNSQQWIVFFSFSEDD